MTYGRNFKQELTSLINSYSRENKSNTPDFILAEYMNECLLTFERLIVKRDEWHDFNPSFWDKIGDSLHEIDVRNEGNTPQVL